MPHKTYQTLGVGQTSSGQRFAGVRWVAGNMPIVVYVNTLDRLKPDEFKEAVLKAFNISAESIDTKGIRDRYIMRFSARSLAEKLHQIILTISRH